MCTLWMARTDRMMFRMNWRCVCVHNDTDMMTPMYEGEIQDCNECIWSGS